MKTLFEKIVNKEESISLVGLGYVGMPIAVAFAKKVNVIGFDLNAAKIDLYKAGIDPHMKWGMTQLRKHQCILRPMKLNYKKQNSISLQCLLR